MGAAKNSWLKINEDVTVGPQPTLEDMQALRDAGFRSLVNFREDGEPNQPLPPHEEGEQAREMGFDYLHVPTATASIRPEVVGQFRQRRRMLATPTYAHCQGGKRAAAMVLMATACDEGWSGEETLRRAETLGINFEQSGLRQFIREYVNTHRPVTTG